MAEILLFHHVQGLTPGVVAFADTLRAAGHTVHTPDQFDGRTFDSIDDGLAYAKEVGFGEMFQRSIGAADGLSDNLVYAGFSIGVLAAQELVHTRPGARGALFFHACAPASEFDAPWPVGVPAQIHGMDGDPFFVDDGDIDAARALADSEESVELFVYPGAKHLFADSSLSSYDKESADLMMGRVLTFLASLDA